MMQLNYKHRFILAMAGYTFALIFIVLAAFWLAFEYIEESDENKSPFLLNQQIMLALKEHKSTSSDLIVRSAFEVHSNMETLPEDLRTHKNYGFYYLKNKELLIIGQHPNTLKNYYLLIHQAEEEAFLYDELEDIILVLLTTLLTTVLVVLLILYMAKKLTLPVIELQEKVRNINIDSEQLPILNRDDEIGQLSRHFSDLITKMRQFTQRERDFTRFSSHELRTPVTVIRGNLDLLDKIIPPTEINQRILKRMNIATTRMTSLIDVFLWLSREGTTQNTYKSENIDSDDLKIIFNQILNTLPEVDKKPLKITYKTLHWTLNPIMLTMVVDNLLRNAIRHGSGDVHVIAENHSLTLYNEKNNDKNTLNEGIGLQIVKKICTVNHWEIRIDNNNDFLVELNFPSAKPN